MPDPDNNLSPAQPQQPLAITLQPCVICGRLSVCETCSEHALLWVIRGLVRIGEKGDWRGYALAPHSDLATKSEYVPHKPAGWRAQVATLLAIHGVWLEEDPGDNNPNSAA